jgi:nucleoside-diphosphate kinase
LAEQTLSIIKPDATKRNIIGKIVSFFEENGLKIAAMEMKWLSKREAEGFYAVHKDKGFFAELVEFMTSSPVVVMVLEGENAVAQNRKIMGATNPAQADAGTIRKTFAVSLSQNSVHGSDSLENARKEIDYFFPTTKIFG